MVHRDIKPSNILIQSWDPLHIKLADFGLANIGWELHTACGTLRYVAPEVYSGKYDSAVDIWSLGVVVFEYAHGLPRYEPREPRQGWYDRLVRSVKAESKKSPLLSFLSSSMIFWDPVIRFTAVMCLHKAKELSTSSKTAGANHKTIGFEKHIPVIESSELLPDTKVELLRKGVRDGAPEQRYVDPRVSVAVLMPEFWHELRITLGTWSGHQTNPSKPRAR
jgi:serine/threonine protein kinase